MKSFFLRVPFLGAFLLALAFYICLHPITGFLGGIPHGIVGWLVPDVILFLISFGIIRKFKVEGTVKCVLLFISVSIMLTFAISLPPLGSYILSEQTTGFHVFRRVRVDTKETATFDSSTNANEFKVYPYLFTPTVEAGGDEGCMCSYFKHKINETYYTVLQDEVNNFLGFPWGLGGYRERHYTLSPAKEIHYAFSSEKTSEGTYNVQFDIFDGDEKTASFWQKGLPSSIVSEEVYPREKDGLRHNFFKNTTSILLKNTFLAWGFSRWSGLSYFPQKEIQKFLNEALVIDE